MNLHERINAKVDEIVAFQEAARQRLREEGQSLMKQALADFWVKYPQVQTIHWLQYTPYFMDGDECVFSAGEVYFTSTPASDLDETYGEDDQGNIETTELRKSGSHGVWERHPVNGATQEMVDDFWAIGQMIHAVDLEDMFGDHVWVKLHRDGSLVEDYEHD